METLKVIATKKGFYGDTQQEEGTVFILRPIRGFRINRDTKKREEVEFSPEQQFSSSWMEKYDAEKHGPEDNNLYQHSDDNKVNDQRRRDEKEKNIEEEKVAKDKGQEPEKLNTDDLTAEEAEERAKEKAKASEDEKEKDVVKYDPNIHTIALTDEEKEKAPEESKAEKIASDEEEAKSKSKKNKS